MTEPDPFDPDAQPDTDSADAPEPVDEPIVYEAPVGMTAYDGPVNPYPAPAPDDRTAFPTLQES